MTSFIIDVCNLCFHSLVPQKYQFYGFSPKTSFWVNFFYCFCFLFCWLLFYSIFYCAYFGFNFLFFLILEMLIRSSCLIVLFKSSVSLPILSILSIFSISYWERDSEVSNYSCGFINSLFSSIIFLLCSWKFCHEVHHPLLCPLEWTPFEGLDLNVVL